MNSVKNDVFRARAQTHPRCAECVCRPDSPEVYTVTRYRDNALLAFDIELASEICQDGRTPVEIPVETLESILKVNAITPEHVDHVDPTVPGISCPVDVTPNRQEVLGLIDGSHRAARCRRDGIPFFAFQMTMEEAQRCLETDAARTCGYLERLIRDSIAASATSRA